MWDFFRHHPGRTYVDPIQEAFFSSESDDENARHLVRESIQNSLDARRGTEPVKVRFTFGELRYEFIDELFAGLPEHLSAQGSGLLAPPSIHQDMRFLAIEDFGTTGLIGAPDQLEDLDNDSEDNFFYFWRNVGRSGKRAGTLGKWGLGKTVFPASSRINTFFGLTRRPEDNASYLLGRCDIKTHRLNEAQYDPYGYYAQWDNDKPMAISDPSQIATFRDAFHLARDKYAPYGNGDTPGLSIIIPHVVDEFNVAMLQREVIENYFWPILKGDLVIEVQENYLTPPETIMNAEWMRQEIDSPVFRQENRELADTIKLAVWANTQQQTPARVVQPRQSTPKWDHETTLSESDLKELIELDRDSEPFSVKIPVWIRPSDGLALSSWFTVYGQHVPYTTRRRSYLVRQGISVGRACATNPPHRVFLVVVETGDLADLMGFAENPSHTNFERTDAIKQDYQRGAMNTIRFVTGSPAAIVRMLDAQDEDSAASLFNNIFWKVPEQSVKPHPRRRKRVVRQGETVSPPVVVERHVTPFFLEKSRDGFHLRDNAKREREIETIIIKAGFEGGRGDPIKRHSKFDFDFQDTKNGGLWMDSSGCELEIVGKNELRLNDLRDGFSFQIVGFDTKRDLTVRATPRMFKR